MKVVLSGKNIRFIYKDEVKDLLKLGGAQVRRASHVEPIMIDGEVHWQADMSPVGGPKLEPRHDREIALEEEVEWLEENGIPAPPAEQPSQ
jgi:hypothetical protein